MSLKSLCMTTNDWIAIVCRESSENAKPNHSTLGKSEIKTGMLNMLSFPVLFLFLRIAQNRYYYKRLPSILVASNVSGHDPCPCHLTRYKRHTISRTSYTVQGVELHSMQSTQTCAPKAITTMVKQRLSFSPEPKH